MAHSVEARVPFLDTDLANYVSRLPSTYKVKGFREKTMLKMAMSDRLPHAILERRKYGFSDPTKELFQTDFRDVCFEELRINNTFVKQYFSERGIDKLFRSIGRGFLTNPEQKLFHIYLFVVWYRLFVRKEFAGLTR